MSTNRTKQGGWIHPNRLPKGANGRNLCRQCGTEVPKGRRTFCGDACVDAWKIKTDPGHVRMLVFQRDHGVCAACGLDTMAFHKALRHLRMSDELWTMRGVPSRDNPIIQAINLAVPGHRTSLWDADHIVPVVEGGGECDLDNYRTLCIWCHQRVTADLRRRLAERRREQESRAKGQAPLFDGEAGIV